MSTTPLSGSKVRLLVVLAVVAALLLGCDPSPAAQSQQTSAPSEFYPPLQPAMPLPDNAVEKLPWFDLAGYSHRSGLPDHADDMLKAKAFADLETPFGSLVSPPTPHPPPRRRAMSAPTGGQQGSIAKATFDGAKLTLEDHDQTGAGTLNR